MNLKKWIFFAGIPLILLGTGGIFYFFRSIVPLENVDNRTLHIGADEPTDFSAQNCEKDPNAFRLFADSKILESQKIKIFIGEGEINGIRTPKICDNQIQGPYYALTWDEIIPVSESPVGEGVVSWGCGGTLPAKSFLFTGGKELPEKSAFLLITGENVERTLQWHPAKEITDSRVCTAQDPALTIQSGHSYQIQDLPFKYKVEEWREEEGQCKAAFHSLSSLNLLEEKSCFEIFHAALDCDGMAADKEDAFSIVKIFGVLTIQLDPEKENWLIFESAGYESSAYSIAPMDSDGKIDRKKIQSLTFAGC